jgi:hypothetical protein
MATLFCTIPSGQALSAPGLEILPMYRVTRIGMPDDWSPTVPITFQISPDNDVYLDLFHVAQNVEGPWMPYEGTTSSPYLPDYYSSTPKAEGPQDESREPPAAPWITEWS